MFAGYFSMEYNQSDYELQLPPEYLPPEDSNQNVFCYNQFFQNIQKNSKKHKDSTATPSFKSTSAPKTTSKSVYNDQNEGSNDFLLLAEGCELEGPIPRLVIPCNGNGDFDLDLFVISLLSVDSQTTKFEFTMHSDSQVFMSQTANNIHAFVEYFTLYDSMARGFVRPFCLAYCSSDHNKLISRYLLMANELSRMVTRLKASNCYLFFTDMSHAFSDLQYTREKLKEMTEAVLIEDEDTNDDDGNNTHIDSNVTGREPSIKASQLQAITTQPTKTTDTINNNASCFFDDSKWETITNELQNEQSTLNQCNDYKQTKNVFSDPNKPFDSGVRKPVVHQKVVKNLDESLPSFIRVSNTCDVDSTMKQDSTLPTKDDAGASDGVATESTKSTSHNKKLSKKLKEVEKTINEVRDILQALNKLLECSEAPMAGANHPVTEVPVKETPLDCVNFNLSRWLEEEAGKKMALEDFDPSWYKWTRKQDSYEPRLKTSLKAKNKRHLRTFNDLCGVDGIDGLHALFKYLKRSELTLCLEANDIQDIDPPEGLLTIGRTVFLNFLANFSSLQVEKKVAQMQQSIYSPISHQPTRWVSNETLISFHTCPSPTFSSFNNEEDDEDCYYNSSDDDDVITAIDTTISHDNDSRNINDGDDNNRNILNNNNEDDKYINNVNNNNISNNNNINNDNKDRIKTSIHDMNNDVKPKDCEVTSDDVFVGNNNKKNNNNTKNNKNIYNSIENDNNEAKRPQSLSIDGRNKNNNRNNKSHNNNNKVSLSTSDKSYANSASRASIVSIADHLTNLNNIKGIGYGIWQVFKLYPEIAVHFSFSLLIGRPLIIYTTSPNHEIAIKKLVTALWMFVPGYYKWVVCCCMCFSMIILIFVTRWCQSPLHLRQLENLKLMGLCRQEKKSFESMIPNDLQEYMTVFNFEKRTLSGPRYKDGILLQAIQKIPSFHSDVSYAAYLHSVLFNLVNKAFIYFHACPMSSSFSSSSSSSWLSRKKCSEKSESFLKDHLLLTSDDAAIVKYLSQIVCKQILNLPLKTRQLCKLNTHTTIKGAF